MQSGLCGKIIIVFVFCGKTAPEVVVLKIFLLNNC